MKRLFYPPPIRLLLMAFMLLVAGSTFLFGEGSIDFRGYPGHRLFYNVEQNQQLKVYANAGETINVGSSHVGINGGTIEVYNPSGALVATFGGTDDIGIIFSDVQELNGPTGTAGGGYIPGVVAVPAGQAGVWSIRLRYPNPQRERFTSELLNGDPWTRAVNQPNVSLFDQRVALAWDVTVTQGGAGDNGGTGVTGRLYSNEYISILDSNGRSTSPTFYILTRFGYLYQVDFSNTDPWGFPIHSNNLGLVTGDQSPIYMSANIGADVSVGNTAGNFTRSSDPSGWNAGENYLYEPQSEDSGNISNNKIFFNIPDVNMPGSGLVTDLNSNNTHTTWLYTEVPTIDETAKPFTFNGILPENGFCSGELVAEEGAGGYFVFRTDLAGQAVFRVDVNNNGSFDDPEDIIIEDNVGLGQDSILWDGRDGEGNIVAANPNFEFAYDLKIRGGEVHLLLADIENNSGGVTFTRLNGPDSPDPDFYFDNSGIGAVNGVSGGGTAGNPQITTTPFTYDGNFGNEKMLDQWAFIETNSFGTGNLAIAIEDTCLPGDNDNDGILDIVDIDDDNDGVPDLLEYCHPTEGFACLPGGLDPSGDADGDGVANFEDANDPAVNNGCSDADGDGVCDQIAAIYDTDGDNVPDHFDLDSDNDGISDLVEAGHNQPDVDGNGVIDGAPAAFGANGLYNPIETNDTQSGVATYTPFDVDGDGIPDHDDLDSDNDGILDVVEAGYASADANQDGRIDDSNVNPDGLAPLIDPAVTGVGIPLPIDWDGDGIPDWHDLDSDNDGILDVIEGGYQGNDSNGDGRIDDGSGNVPSVNSDGLPPVMNPALTGTVINLPPDTDGDGIPDWHDLDSDNDGINDTVENRNPDGDGDGFIGTGPITVDANGVAIADANGPITPFTPLVNTDGEGPGDFRDLDSDGDGINDVIEGGSSDPDGDGIIGTGTPTVNPFGQSTEGTTSNPPDTDGNGTPDFQEIQQVEEACETPAIPTLSASGTNLCEGDALTLTATGVTDTDVSYIWTASGANGVSEFITDTPTLPLSQLAVSNTAIYTVVARRDTCSSANSNGISVVVNPRPAAPILSATATSVCEGESVTLNAGAATANTTYRWTLTAADGTFAVVATTNEPILPLDGITVNQTGTYTVEALGGGGACPSGVSNGVAIVVSPIGAAPTLTTSATSACAGEAITLTAGGGGANTTYQWTLTTADGTSSVVATTDVPTFTATQSGTYTVELTVGGDACSNGGASNSVTIDIADTPAVPTLTASATNVCQGESIALNAGTATANTTYQWTLTNADGSSSVVATTDTPDFSASQTGTYTVEAIGNGTCPSGASNGVAITVIPRPAALTLSANASGVCEGEAVTLTASPAGVAGTTYQWTLTAADGSSSVVATTDTPTLPLDPIAANQAGTYTVEASDPAGACPSGPSNAVAIAVTPKPATPVMEVDKAIHCEGDTLMFFVAPVEGDNVIYEFTFTNPDGRQDPLVTTSIPSATIQGLVAANTGTYQVRVIVDGCPSDFSNDVPVDVASGGLPNAEATSSAPIGNSVCEGEGVTLSVVPLIDDASYEWSGPNGVVGNEAEIILVAATPEDNGEYTVTITVNGCPKTVGPVTVAVDAKPATPTVSSDTDSACPGEAVTFNTAAATGDNITYDWLLDGTVVATTDSPTYTDEDFQEADAGNYTVVVNEGGCPSDPSDPVAVSLREALEGVTASSNSPVCIGDPINLTVTDVEGATFEWTGPNGFTSTEQNPTVVDVAAETDAGDYTVIVTVDGCPASIPPATVDVTPKPAAPTVSISEGPVCEGTAATITVADAQANTTYTVSDAAGNTVASGTEATIEIPTDGAAGDNTYTVVAQEDGGCPSEPSNAVNLTVTPQPDEEAMILTDPMGGDDCGGTPGTVEATVPAQGTGMWTSSNEDVVFTDAANPTTEVMGLEDGDVVTWTLSNDACGEYASASITISAMQPETTANPDGATILNNETATGNVANNDTPSDGIVTVISGPSNGVGSIDANGNYSYTPNSSFVGDDQIVYEICNRDCPDAPCAQSTLTITVNQANIDCVVPDVISPNSDGLNDALVIPCSDSKRVALKIFNRWGDLVFESDNYDNNWAGTHDGNDLPPGPYYYVFEEDGVEAQTGCVSIAR